MGWNPNARRWVVKLRACDRQAIQIAAGNKDLAILEQRRRVIVSCGRETARFLKLKGRAEADLRQ